MRLAVRYDLWPRRRDQTLMFRTTSEAFFYAAQIFNRTDLIIELDQQFNLINRELEKEKGSKTPNLAYMLNTAFKRQFHRECLEEIERLRHSFGV